MATKLPPLPRITAMRDQGQGMQALLRAIVDIQRRLGGVGYDDTILNAKTAANAATSQAQTAAAIASSAGAGLASNGVVGVLFGCSSAARVEVASTALVGVTAGTLRFDTTSIYALNTANIVPDGIFSGGFWITQRLTAGGPKTDLYADTFTLISERQGIYHAYINNIPALDAARPATGPVGGVTYGLDVARVSGTQVATNFSLDFRVAQAS
jgi:hypothetical protein